jgi:hypothetical protein
MPRKRCKRCGSLGPFYKNGVGLRSLCCGCHKSNMKIRRQSPRSKALVMWSNIKARAQNKDGKNPSYSDVIVLMSKDEFVAWATAAIAKWSKRNPTDTVSVDRKRSRGHYELNNLRIISHGDNSRNTSRCKNAKASSGMAWCTGECKAYLPIGDFYRNRSARHGLQFKCKRCSNAANRRSRERKAG